MFELYGVVILSLFGFGTAVDKEIKPGDGFVPIIPFPGKGETETNWHLRSPEGSKIVLQCNYLAFTRKETFIKVNTGKEMLSYAPETLKTFRVQSYKNRMEVTIMNFGLSGHSSCNITATPLYTKLTVPTIDSIEEGQSQFAKKQTAGCKCGWANKNKKRIVGGVETGINEFPFIVRLKYAATGRSFCGGSIITVRHVLTAAHCLYSDFYTDIVVVVGEHDLLSTTETTATKDIGTLYKIIHEGYDFKEQVNDIAMIVLVEDIQFSLKVGPICLPNLFQQTPADTIVKAIGWGLTKQKQKGGQRSNVLRKVNLRVVDPQICSDIYETLEYTTICTYNSHKDVCQGDSGGPIFKVDPETNMYKLVSIVSFGSKCGTTNPTVSTDVAHYLNWIQQKVAETIPQVMCH